MTDRDWVAWHEAYERPGSSMSRRLELVRQRIREALDRARPGRVRVVSMCAGQGRDFLEVLRDHPRRDDVDARLVELDRGNVALARSSLAQLGLESIELVEGDAAVTTAYEGAVPADLVLACGIFGNVTEADVRNTIAHLPLLCAPGAVVIWTRHRREPDLTPTIRDWFGETGFEALSFDSDEHYKFGIGVARLVGSPKPFVSGVRLFEFVGDGTTAAL